MCSDIKVKLAKNKLTTMHILYLVIDFHKRNNQIFIIKLIIVQIRLGKVTWCEVNTKYFKVYLNLSEFVSRDISGFWQSDNSMVSKILSLRCAHFVDG